MQITLPLPPYINLSNMNNNQKPGQPKLQFDQPVLFFEKGPKA